MTINADSIPFKVPEYGRRMQVIGLGTMSSPPVGPERTTQAIVEAIKGGYRHFDTASKYQTEQSLGEAIKVAFSQGLIQSRDEVFITTKLWCPEAHGDLVVLSLKRSLENLKLDYVDLYLIHWPVSAKPGKVFPLKKEDILPMDFKAVWRGMEESQKLGLTKSIGVSNWTTKRLVDLLAIANIPPAVNQVELNPVWQQKKLRDFCKAHNIIITAFSPLGAANTAWGCNLVIDSEVLKEIAKTKGKTVGQICLQWAYQINITVVVKSFNSQRMRENLDIFDWELSDEEMKKIEGIPQHRIVQGQDYISPYGEYKTVEELWDGEI